MVDFRIDVVVDPSGAVAGTRTVERELTRVQNRADGLRGSFARAFAFLGGTALLGSAVRTLAEFEQSLATVAGVSGATADQLEVLRAKALELGATTRFTATQSADALVELSRAGFTVSESLTAVGDTLLLAQAGGLELARATDIATSVLRGFRLAADQAGRVADVLAQAANSTNTSVEELGEGMKFVAPIAAGLGVSLEQASAAMGTLSNAGLKASLAGTGLRRVLAELESPSEKSAEILRSLGVRTNEVRVSQVGLVGALKRLKDAGLDTGQALEVFGDRGGPAFEVLTSNIPELEKLIVAMEGAGGTAAKTAKIMDDNLQGSLRKLKSAFEALVLSLGGAGGSSALRSAFEGLANGLRFLAANADTIIKFLQNLALFLGPRYLLGAIRAIGVAIAANPLGLLLTVIAAVVAVIPDLQTKLESLVVTLGELASKVTAGLNFADLFRGLASAVDAVVAMFNGLLAAGGAVFDALATQPQAAGELMKKGFRDAIEAVLDYFLAFNQTVGNIIIGVGKDVIDLARNVGGAIGAISVGNLEASQSFADNLTSTIQRAGNRIVTFTGQFQSNLKKLRDTEILPEVELTQEAFALGNQVADEFQRAFTESTPTAQQALDNLLGKPDELAAEAARRAEALKKSLPKPELAPPPKEPPKPLSNEAQELLKQLDVQKQLADQEAVYQELLAKRPDLENAIRDSILAAKIAALDTSTALEAGFTRAFLKLQQEAQDLAAVAENVVNAFADRATDAIVEFARTGEFNFKKFATAVLEDITRILVRLLVVQAISAALGGGSAGLVTTGVNAAAGGGGGRAKGGTVQPDRSYMVGENGPELFQPNQTGTIVPNAGSVPAEPPNVNVQVVNVDDPNKVPQTISSGAADEAIINTLVRNKDRVSQIIR